MIREWIKKCKMIKINRIIIIGMVFTILLTQLVTRIYCLQIIEGKEYKENYNAGITKTLTEKSVRGNIYDRNGKLLAGNELVYNVTVTDSKTYESNRERQLSLNGILWRLAEVLKENQDTVNNELEIELTKKGEYKYTSEGSSLLRMKADVYGVADIQDLTREQKEITAEEMIKYLAGPDKFALYGEGDKDYSREEQAEYGLKQNYSKQEVLEIIGLRYMLSLNAYRRYIPITAARDISLASRIYVLEHSDTLEGVTITKDYKRVYYGGDAFAHIIGYTGKISSEELLEKKEKNTGYTSDSTIGKTGIEQYMENELRGTGGVKKITVDDVGKTVGDTEIVKEALPGKDVYLSVNLDLQKAVYHILEQNIAGIILSHLINAKEFDKTKIIDASQIKIPVYDVYNALIQNNIISINQRSEGTGSRLESSIQKRLDKKEKNALENIRKDLLEGTNSSKDVSKEMKEYQSIIAGELNLFKEDKADKEDRIYKAWSGERTVSMKELLEHAMEKGWLNIEDMKSDEMYLTKDEMYQLLVEEIGDRLKENENFHKLLFRYLLLEDNISGREVCLLLYEQGILSKKQEDYKALKDGTLGAYEFIKKKIKNLEITPAQLALDPCSGSAVVLDAKTGKAAACVTYPGYDNNRLADRMDSGYYTKLYEDLSLPFYNRATQQLTAPGSTFKPITIIAGLNEQVITPDTSVYCDGVFDKVVPTLKCWKHTGHGKIKSASSALKNSCNDYMCEISYRLGSRQNGSFADDKALLSLQKWAKLFDLDKKSGIEITESEPKVSDRFGIPSAIGQGTHNFTTVQLARYANILATKGKSFQVSILDGMGEPGGNIEKQEPRLLHELDFSDRIWASVEKGMEEFANNNDVLKDMEITVGGKTGTAQESKTRPDHSLFIGFAPLKEPEITIAVRVANGYGSSNATGIGRDIFNYYFKLEDEKNIVTGKASLVSNSSTD